MPPKVERKRTKLHPITKDDVMPTQRRPKATVHTLRTPDEVVSSIARIEERTMIMSNRIDSVDERISKLVDVMLNLARVEERQLSIKGTLEEHIRDETETLTTSDARLAKIERALPSLLETRKWIVAGALGIVALVGVSMYDAIFHQKTPLAQFIGQAVSPTTTKPTE